MSKLDGLVIGGCSALRRIYRDHIRSTLEEPVLFIHLTGSRELIAERMAKRTGHCPAYRMLDILDEFTREAPMIRVKRKLSSIDVLDALTYLLILRGPPAFIRSDNGPEFVAQMVRDWIAAVGADTAFIEPRITLGERLLRKLQCPSAGRTAQRRDLLLHQGSRDRNAAKPSRLPEDDSDPQAQRTRHLLSPFLQSKVGPWVISKSVNFAGCSTRDLFQSSNLAQFLFQISHLGATGHESADLVM